mgnify:CR=1 FL=1
MKKYEIMFIVRSDVEEGANKKVFADMEKVLSDNGAKLTLSKDMGQKQLAYEIKKNKSGFYYLFNIEANDDKAIKEFDRLALINDKIIRHLIISIEK